MQARPLIHLILAAAILMIPARPSAEEVDWKKGKLEHLAPTIGTYRLDEVLSDPYVDATLAAMLSAEARAVLTENLQVAGPIDFIGGFLVLSGNRPHYGTEETAVVWISIYDGTTYVILQRYGKFTLYAKTAEFYYLPIQLRAKLALPLEDIPWREPPPGVTWVGKTTEPGVKTPPSPPKTGQ